jgi:hypothetical protein
LYDENMTPQPLDPNEHVYFYQQDLHATIEYPEPDLPEPESPWRRVYGPALNSNLLDRGFLFGSIILTGIMFLDLYYSNAAFLLNDVSRSSSLGIAFCSIVALFLGGELDRRDQEAPFGKTLLDPLRQISFLKIPLVIIGGALAILWIFLYRDNIASNLEAIGSKWISIAAAGLLLTVMSFGIIKWQTRKGRSPAIV